MNIVTFVGITRKKGFRDGEKQLESHQLSKLENPFLNIIHF
jgi:hypothetical protein